jgi:putative ABC transport system permease protein
VGGRVLLLGRLAVSDLRHHFAQAVLFVVAIAAATTVLSLAFALNGVNSNPYQQTMAATNGPDVVAQSGNDPYTGVTSPADLAALEALNHAKGVAAHSGLWVPKTSSMQLTWGYCAGGLENGIGTR